MRALNLTDFKQVIPPGVNDNSVEFYVDKESGTLRCMCDGQRYVYPDVPQWIKDKVNEDMSNNPDRISCLIDWGFEESVSQMGQYIACVYGGYDSTPDIDAEGIMQPSEYVDCGRRCGLCPYEGKLCASIQLEKGILTEMNIKVLKSTGKGMLDKEIADEHGISIHTVRHNKDSISKKSGLSRKPAFTALALELRLISYEDVKSFEGGADEN